MRSRSKYTSAFDRYQVVATTISGVLKEGLQSFNNPKVRSFLIQFGLLAVALYLGMTIIENTITNLERAGISSGFGFLGTSAGFDISMTLVSYSEADSFGRALLIGFLNTILVAVLGIVTATVLGFFVGIMRLSANPLVAKVSEAYVELMRNIPLLIQIFIWYKVVLTALPHPKNSISFGDAVFLSNRGLTVPRFLWGDGSWLILAAIAMAAVLILFRWNQIQKLQEATGERKPLLGFAVSSMCILPVAAYALFVEPLQLEYPIQGKFNLRNGVVVVPEFAALYLALSVYTAAFIAEIVRAGIEAVDKGQTEAATALGIRPGLTMKLVVIPQAMRVIIPMLASQYLNLTKNSTLAVAIGYPDLVATGGTVLNLGGQAVEIITIWMLVYLTLSLITSAFMNWFNAYVRLVER